MEQSKTGNKRIDYESKLTSIRINLPVAIPGILHPDPGYPPGGTPDHRDALGLAEGVGHEGLRAPVEHDGGDEEVDEEVVTAVLEEVEQRHLEVELEAIEEIVLLRGD